MLVVKGTPVHSTVQTALAQLSETALERMMLELGRYALSVSSRLRWRTGDAVDLPRGETVYSIVSLAFEKVLTGERRWDPQQEPDLKIYLMNVIDSLLSHLSRHKDNTALTAMPATGSERQTPASSSLGQRPSDPEMALLHKEQVYQEEQALQLLLDATHDDPLVRQIIQAMRAGHGKPGEIADALGIAVTEVYKAMKRLDRKIARMRNAECRMRNAECGVRNAE